MHSSPAEGSHAQKKNLSAALLQGRANQRSRSGFDVQRAWRRYTVLQLRRVWFIPFDVSVSVIMTSPSTSGRKTTQSSDCSFLDLSGVIMQIMNVLIGTTGQFIYEGSIHEASRHWRNKDET